MIDYVIETAISNSIFAIILATIALAVTVKAKRPQLAYLLWVVVFLKLVTPPIINVPVSIASSDPIDIVEPVDTSTLTDLAIELPENYGYENNIVGEESTSSFWVSILKRYLKPVAMTIWFVGSLILLTIGIRRVRVFNRLLRIRASSPSVEVISKLEELAKSLEVSKLPQVIFVDAKISPMVWWTGGCVQIVLPKWLTNQLSENDWKNVIAHELAHVKRKDYLTRWLEWSVCTLFWWNPVAWWAQKNLRAVEEICCDSLVLNQLNTQPQAYANSILQAVESLVCPEVRPPVMASQINSGGFLERRFEMILSGSLSTKRSLASQLLVLITIALLIPLGLIQAQDIEKIERKLDRMVENGKLEPEHAEVMLEALIELLEEQEQEENEWREREDEEEGDEWTNRQEMMKQIERQVHVASRKIEEAVKDGRLSEKDGRRKLEDIQHKAHERIRRMEEEIHEHRRHEREHARHERDRQREQELHEREHARHRHDRERLDREIHEHEYEIHAHDRHEQREHRMQKLIEELKSAVENGRMEESEAATRIEQMKKRAEFAAIREKIGAAVEAGKISERDAEKKLKALKDKMSSNQRSRKDISVEIEMNQVLRKLEMAVKNGDLTKEQAREKMDAIIKERDILAHKERDHSIEKIDRHLDEMLTVLAKKMKQPGLAGEIKEKIAEHGSSEKSKIEAIRFIEEMLHKTEIHKDKMRAIAIEIREAVKAGKLSRADAKKKMEFLYKEMSSNEHDDDHDHDDTDHHHDDDDEHDDHGHDDHEYEHDDDHARK